MSDETVVFSKATRATCLPIRRKAKTATGTIARRALNREASTLERQKPTPLNPAQRHIRARSGTWDATLSGEDLLRRTRP